MQNFEQLGRELERRGKTEQIKQLAESIDANAVEQAAKSGDGEALRSLLGSLLSTQEGKRLAESVRRMMDN